MAASADATNNLLWLAQQELREKISRCSARAPMESMATAAQPARWWMEPPLRVRRRKAWTLQQPSPSSTPILYLTRSEIRSKLGQPEIICATCAFCWRINSDAYLRMRCFRGGFPALHPLPCGRHNIIQRALGFPVQQFP